MEMARLLLHLREKHWRQAGGKDKAEEGSRVAFPGSPVQSMLVEVPRSASSRQLCLSCGSAYVSPKTLTM